MGISCSQIGVAGEAWCVHNFAAQFSFNDQCLKGTAIGVDLIRLCVSAFVVPESSRMGAEQLPVLPED